jgi:hypothetical protein
VSHRIRSREVDEYALLDPVDPLEDAIANAGFDDAFDEDEDEDGETNAH